jgi:fructose-bisphosphate aldolase class I
VRRVVVQQFEVAERIRAAGLVPIVEPEVDIRSPQKREAEDLLLAELTRHLDALGDGPPVMLKLSLPTVDDLYAPLVAHPRVLRVVALSGGYSRDEANALLARNHGVIASFSRALVDGLRFQHSPAEFDAALDASIASIAAASAT